jgi:dipeptidyl aminopeptidase/acylaminoacyl peptidase
VKSGELPDYDEKGALTAYENATVTRKDGQEKTAPVLITNGKLLCWRPDGMAYVFVKPFFMGNTDGSGYTSYEKIYINDLTTNTPTLLTEFDYSSITKAEFSSDGRYLAFLVGNDESRLLCIYDFQNSSKQVATASEAGLGADTANFVWGTGDKANTIFAITGDGNFLQLMSYMPTDNGPVVEKLEEEPLTDGSMGFFDGKLFYSQSNPDDASKSGIYSYDVSDSNAEAKRICDGDYFDLNSTTGAMAITKDDREVRIFSIRSSLDKSIIKGKDVSSVVWSSDGSMLYYLLYQYDYDSANGDRFILKLYQYNTKSNESKELTDVVEGQFIQSDKSSELLMVYIYSQDNRFVPITYRITVNES